MEKSRLFSIFLDRYLEYCSKFRKEREEKRIAVKELCFCSKRYYASGEEVLFKPQVIIGTLVDMGIKSLIYFPVIPEPKIIEKEIEGYTIVGSPDIITENGIIEIKYSTKSNVNDWDVLQLRIYLWLCDMKYGELWYYTPMGIVVEEINNPCTDDEIIDLIKRRDEPKWKWECITCQLDCEKRKEVIK